MTKKIYLVLICICGCVFSAYSQDKPANDVALQKKVEILSIGQSKLNNEVQRVANDANKTKSLVQSIKRQNDELKNEVDSLNKVTISLAEKQSTDKDSLDGQIKIANTHLASNQSALSNRTMWGIALIVIVVLLLILAFVLVNKKMKVGETSMMSTIDDVRKTQASFQVAQAKLQENSVNLDNQLLLIADKQLKIWEKDNTSKDNAVPDHSLVVKLADDLARIETNLSKMDKSVRGYKQLVQAKDRMINNVRAYGYEIISLIGQEYNDGMQFQARFVPDDTLPEGKRVITGMIKMQVNYNGKMIQPAEIVVSQNI